LVFFIKNTNHMRFFHALVLPVGQQAGDGVRPRTDNQLKMTRFKVPTLATMALIWAGAAQGQILTNVSSTSVNALIPDGNFSGISSQAVFSGIPGTILNVTVTLDVTGGFNGDLYATLSGPASEFAVLLNRTGLTSTNASGYNDTGFNITIADGFPNLHNYQLDSPMLDDGTGQLTGSWGPDGRAIDPRSPGSTFDSTLPTADLSGYNGNAADGAWTLFVADVANGGQSTLVSWGLTVITAPEPQSCLLLASGVGLWLSLSRRRKH
jgi:subtilisin-like proprotein convertase family protein